MATKTKTYKEGDVYRSGGRVYAACAGEEIYKGETKLRGKARKVFAGADGYDGYDAHDTSGHPVYVHRGTNLIFCGCHRLPALEVFRALGAALGYDVE